MSHGGWATHLSDCPALRRLEPSSREALLPFLVSKDFAINDLLCAKGEPPEGLFILLSGDVLISLPQNVRGWRGEMVFTRGHVFGEAAFEPAAVELDVYAVTAGSALLIPGTRRSEVFKAVPELERVLRALTDLRSMWRGLIPAIRQYGPLRDVSARAIAHFVSEAHVEHLDAGQALVHQNDPPTGLYYLAEGQLKAERHDGAGDAVVQLHYPGGLIGGVALETGKNEPSTVIAMTDSTLGFLPLESFQKWVGRSEEFARSLNAGKNSPILAGHAASRAGKWLPAGKKRQFILLVSNLAAHRLGALNALIAETIARDPGHDAMIVEIRSAPAKSAAGVPAPPSQTRGPNKVWRLAIDLPNLKEAETVVLASILRSGLNPTHVLVQIDQREPDLIDALSRLLSKIVFLTSDSFSTLPLPGLEDIPTIYSVPIGSPARESEPAYRMGTVRLKLDLEAIGRLRPEETQLSRLSLDVRATLARWCRAITDRRVGVALGGGGSWGFAHVTLLKRLHQAGLPIDMVSGTSFGSMVGAYYCALGLNGLDLLFKRGLLTNLATAGSIVTSKAIEAAVDWDLKPAMLEGLEVPLFPVAVDITTGREFVVTVGTAGYGVRASGSFAGLFAATTTDHQRFIDGGFIDNVPVHALIREGADLIIASEIVPAPSPVHAKRRSSTAIGRVLRELNPVARVQDLIQGGLLLMHSAGNNGADLADELYDSEPVNFAPWDFRNGRKIAELAEPRVDMVVERVKTRWRRMSCLDLTP